MEFKLYERKFKLVDYDLYSFYKTGGSKTEKWYQIKLSLDKSTGYKVFAFKIEGKQINFKYHRVVYYAHNNDWDFYDSSKDNIIDHIDGVKTNNHISNLRNVTNQENSFNTRARGCSFDKARGKYKAQITLNKKNIHIGRYDTEQEAHQAYVKAKREMHEGATL